MPTAKDFIATAQIIARGLEAAQSVAEKRTILAMAGSFADLYQNQNPRFDRGRFLKACGVDGIMRGLMGAEG